jgi:hypothetical protein
LQGRYRGKKFKNKQLFPECFPVLLLGLGHLKSNSAFRILLPMMVEEVPVAEEDIPTKCNPRYQLEGSEVIEVNDDRSGITSLGSFYLDKQDNQIYLCVHPRSLATYVCPGCKHCSK